MQQKAFFFFRSPLIYTQIWLGPGKSEVGTFFPKKLVAGYCDIVLTAEAVEHILGFE